MSGGHVYLADCDAGFMAFLECAAVFVDGFESGDSSAWSVAVP